jgi:hypothetical protein
VRLYVLNQSDSFDLKKRRPSYPPAEKVEEMLA